VSSRRSNRPRPLVRMTMATMDAKTRRMHRVMVRFCARTSVSHLL
jgi:hypothetical protein